MEHAKENVKLRQLLEDGYCIYENILDEAMLERLRETAERLAEEQTTAERALNRSTGSMIPVTKDPVFAELVAWPRALDALASLTYSDPKFYGGYVISKPPQSPPLFWHYDYPVWDHPDAFEKKPHQLFLMYYLTDTSPFNGCLRVIPGTHLYDNPLHAELEEAHSRKLLQAEDLDSPAFSMRPDEIDVAVRAGDLLIGDARLLHASHANRSDHRRTVITLWYNPDFSTFSEPLKAFYSSLKTMPPDSWPAKAKQLIEPLWTQYDGEAEPLPWNRIRPMRGSVNRK
ncbi:phytanoyl-CoA dioxygenase family protein [Paenibacillus montanisoli]|uniref:Phytanoyl-CoA dioxygenase n=1 Tax=Paenibacillus montanisoli TaxID=2081970 RepID=A0A328U443_9BACL|nr:phytanoyl-CoA dioxygenase family protein [Paenibacillus montanisoli]RAP76583.1 hypothetical protein DL346_14550 [Paenibacillus montanisoli]